MSFIKRGVNNQQTDQAEQLEEQYKRLMPKIGRDFVTRDDLNTVIARVLALVDPFGLNPLDVDDTAARDLAERYKRLVEKGKDGGEADRDLVKIDDEEE